MTQAEETLRMLKALIQAGKVEFRPTGKWGTVAIKTAGLNYGCDSLERAIAEAYRVWVKETQ